MSDNTEARYQVGVVCMEGCTIGQVSSIINPSCMLGHLVDSSLYITVHTFISGTNLQLSIAAVASIK